MRQEIATDSTDPVACINSMPRHLRLRPVGEIAHDLGIPHERAYSVVTAADRALVDKLQAETDGLVEIVQGRAAEIEKRLAEADRMDAVIEFLRGDGDGGNEST